MLTSEQIKKDWKEEREWYQNPDTNLWLRLGDFVRLGDCVSLGDYVRLVSINHEYVGTLVVDKSGVEIRIGCEVHSAAQWDLHGKKLAEKHNESAWWEATGKYMLELLKVEALNIEKELKKGQEVS